MPKFDTNIASQRWEACKSISTETIPAYAAVQVLDADLAVLLGSVSSEPVLRVTKPTIGDVDSGIDPYGDVAEFYATRGHRIRFNGPVPIPPGGFGYAPVAGQWYLGEVSQFAGTSQVTDWIGVYQAAFLAPISTNQSDCRVAWIVRQSRVREDLS